MNSRRHFIKNAGKSLIATAVGHGLLTRAAAAGPQEKIIRIGIIGAENSHTIGFGNLFNTHKKFPGMEVKYVWGETEELARKAMNRGNIPFSVKDPREMLGRIDALIVDHRHPKQHLSAAEPFIKEGIPVFIDKPFCYRASEGIEFLRLAKQSGAPVTSYSSIAHSDATFDKKAQVNNRKDILQVICTGPADLNSAYGGIFFYGVHIVQPLMYVFGEDIERVKVTRDGNFGNAGIQFKSGLFATLVFKRKAYGWETFIETPEKLMPLQSRVEEQDPPRNYTDMAEMFRSGREPRDHQSILNCVSVLEALEKSADSGKWVDMNYQLL